MMRSSLFQAAARGLAMSTMAAAAWAQPRLDLGKREFAAECAAGHGVNQLQVK